MRCDSDSGSGTSGELTIVMYNTALCTHLTTVVQSGLDTINSVCARGGKTIYCSTRGRAISTQGVRARWKPLKKGGSTRGLLATTVAVASEPDAAKDLFLSLHISSCHVEEPSVSLDFLWRQIFPNNPPPSRWQVSYIRLIAPVVMYGWASPAAAVDEFERECLNSQSRHCPPYHECDEYHSMVTTRCQGI